MGSLLQNSPFSGQAIDSVSGKVVHIHDFIGTFTISDSDETSWETITISRASNTMRTFSFNDVSLTLQEYSEGDCGVGAGCWLSSVAMLSWIASHQDIFENKRVLEIGCGVGLGSLGLSASQAKPSKVTASDYNVFLKNGYEKNMEVNKHCLNSIPKFALLNWEDTLNPSYQPDSSIGQYDVIIASDCIYKSTMVEFKSTVLHHLAPNGSLIFMNPQRNGVDQLIYSLGEIGETEVRHVSVTMNGLHSVSLMFIIFKI